MELDWSRQPKEIEEEKRIIKLSFVVAACFFIASLAVAILSRSLALGIDAAYLFLDLCLVMLTIFWLEKLFLPADNRYNFGYFKLEPMIVMLQCISLLGICAVGSITAIQHLLYALSGGQLGVSNYAVTLVFTSSSIVICAFMWAYAERMDKIKKSKILAANILAYKIDFFICSGLFVSFLIAYLLKKNGLMFYSELPDPIISIILCIFLVKEPIYLLKESAYDLLDINPSHQVQLELEGAIRKILMDKYNQSGEIKVKLRKAGRKYFAIAHYRVNQDMRFEQVDDIRKYLDLYFSENFPSIHLACHPE